MPYRFVTENRDYSDFASGRVLYAMPGQPAFPVRLASEIFQRYLAYRQGMELKGPVTIYDPCCGSAYHLVALAYLHWYDIGQIIASDIDADVLGVAAKNLNLLRMDGLERREAQIKNMMASFGKPSHVAAMESATRFKGWLESRLGIHQIKTLLFCADATRSVNIQEELSNRPIDLVFADVPYGWHSAWQQTKSETTSLQPPLWLMLAALRPVLSTQSIVVIAADKSQKCAHEAYRRLERFRLGKRQIFLLQPV